MPGARERFQVVLDRIAIRAGDFGCIGDCYAPALTAQFKIRGVRKLVALLGHLRF